MAKDGRKDLLRGSVERSTALAVGLFLGALVFIVGGVEVGGPIGTILAAIGSTMGTTALVSFLYNPFLRDILAREILQRVGLRDAVVRAGLDDICDGVEMTLEDVFLGSQKVVAAPLDPFVWAGRTYPEIVRAATRSVTHVVALLPSPDPGAGRTVLARRLGMSENELTRKLSELPFQLEQAWDLGHVAAGSKLEVYAHSELVSVGLMTCDRCAVLEIGPAVAHSATESTTQAQRLSADSPYARWAEAQLAAMEREATGVTVRPITASAQLPGRRASATPGIPATAEAGSPAPASQRAAAGAPLAGRTLPAEEEVATTALGVGDQEPADASAPGPDTIGPSDEEQAVAGSAGPQAEEESEETRE